MFSTMVFKLDTMITIEIEYIIRVFKDKNIHINYYENNHCNRRGYRIKGYK